MKHRRFLGLFAVLLLAAVVQAQCGCAIPVRPVAFMEQDDSGKWHFTQDEAGEPHYEDAVSFFAPLLKLAGGPYGEAALAMLTLILGHQVGHRRGQKAAKAKPASHATVTMAPPPPIAGA